MANLISISESKKSINNIALLLDELYITKNISYEEFYGNINDEFLSEYKVMMFILNPFNVGNSNFIRRLKELISTRLNTKSIYFVIDGKYELDKRELLKVRLEIEESLKDIIDEPKVNVFSSMLAATYYMYKSKMWDISEIRKNRDIFFTDDDGYIVSGNSISEDDVLNFEEMSEILTLRKSIKEDLDNFRDIDVNKIMYAVVGNSMCGKTTFIENMNKLNAKIDFLEYNDISELNTSVAEGIVVILDTNHEKNIELLNLLEEEYYDVKKIIILNKIDEYMYTDDDYVAFVNKVKSYTKKYANQNLYVLSSYYINLWLSLKNNEIEVEDVINDKNVVLLNKFNIPIVKFMSNKDFIKNFKNQNYLEELLEVERRCLNHLQK